MTRSEAKQRAKVLGTPFGVVEDAYRQLRLMQRQEREYEWTIRRVSWELQTPAGCHEFWRHGWLVRYPYAFGEGDRGNILGFDETAMDMAFRFPELDRDGDPGAALWAIISQTHRTLPSADQIWDEAIEVSTANADEWATPSDLEAVPF